MAPRLRWPLAPALAAVCLGLLDLAAGASLRAWRRGLALRSEAVASTSASAGAGAAARIGGQDAAAVARTVEQLDLDSAIQAASPPEDALALLRQQGQAGGESGAGQEPGNYTRAVGMLNDMIFKTETRLDEKRLAVREFEERTSATREQVHTDLARLAQELSDNQRMLSEAMNGIQEADANAQEIKETLEKEHLQYTRVRSVDQAQLTERQNDLDQAEFILNLTRCPGGPGVATLLQLGARRPGVARRAARAAAVAEACLSKPFTDRDVLFKDRDLDSAVRRLSRRGLEMLQLSVSSEASRYYPKKSKKTEPKKEEKQASRCTTITDACFMHDHFAALWGGMLDLVDESTAKVNEDDTEWKTLKANLNSQLGQIATQEGELQSTMAEVSSNKATLQDQQAAKMQEAADLDAEIHSTMTEGNDTINTLFIEMCGAIKVRNDVVSHLPDVSTRSVDDCTVGDWVPGDCSMDCDDNLVGGTQVLTREIITRNSSLGAECPITQHTSVCNQVRCPVDCELGEWSSFSACTKECGGGVQSRTRKQTMQAKNGGQQCDALENSQTCNTGSCDRDCGLADWTAFSGCSVACGGGFQERTREVLVEARALGTCPAATDGKRYQSRSCNEKPCVGDEECIARMDLVVAVDGSGSLTEAGFDIVRNFSAQLVRRMQSDSYGHEAMRVAALLFGNGHLNSDRTISDAVAVSQLTGDMDGLAAQLDGLAYQKGFTNMAQALYKAKKLLGGSTRSSAEPTVLVITDGRPSFKYQTRHAVNELRQSARLVIVHVKQYRTKDEEDLMKSYASSPWETNYIHVQGIDELEGSYDRYVTRTLTETCPRAESPSAIAERDRARGYRLVRESMVCAQLPRSKRGNILSTDYCKAFAAHAFTWIVGSWQAFAYDPVSHWCLAYASACTAYYRNTTFNVYEPVAYNPAFL